MFLWTEIIGFERLRYESWFHLDFVIPNSAVGESVSLGLVKDVKVFVVFRGNFSLFGAFVVIFERKFL